MLPPGCQPNPHEAVEFQDIGITRRLGLVLDRSTRISFLPGNSCLSLDNHVSVELNTAALGDDAALRRGVPERAHSASVAVTFFVTFNETAGEPVWHSCAGCCHADKSQAARFRVAFHSRPAEIGQIYFHSRPSRVTSRSPAGRMPDHPKPEATSLAVLWCENGSKISPTISADIRHPLSLTVIPHIRAAAKL